MAWPLAVLEDGGDGVGYGGDVPGRLCLRDRVARVW